MTTTQVQFHMYNVHFSYRCFGELKMKTLEKTWKLQVNAVRHKKCIKLVDVNQTLQGTWERRRTVICRLQCCHRQRLGFLLQWTFCFWTVLFAQNSKSKPCSQVANFTLNYPKIWALLTVVCNGVCAILFDVWCIHRRKHLQLWQ